MGYFGIQPIPGPIQDGAIGGTAESIDIDTVNGNILATPFSLDRTDLTGNHTIAAKTSVLTADSGYTGETTLETFEDAGDGIRTGTSEPAHAIGGVSPVTFGAFMKVTSWQSNGQILTSSASGGSANYGLIRFTGGNWAFRGAIGGGEGQAWKTMIGLATETQANVWFHIAMRCDSGTNTGSFFLNGQRVWDGTFGTNGRHTALATDQFNFNESSSSVDNPGFTCFWRNVFINDTAMSDSAIRLISDQAWGHASPYTSKAL